MRFATLTCGQYTIILSFFHLYLCCFASVPGLFLFKSSLAMNDASFVWILVIYILRGTYYSDDEDHE